jgi:hypothetical protein
MLFTIHSYRNLLQTIKDRKYIFSTDLDSAAKVLLLRHDVDFDLNLAHEMAIIENSLGVSSVYLVMISNPLYDIHSREAIISINEIKLLGHQIGLHYDPSISDYCSFEDQFLILENAFEAEIKYYSHHQPTIYGFNGELSYENKIDLNLHVKEFKYISDSCMQPREDFFITLDAYTKVQLLVHPEFWMLNSVDLYDFGEKLKKLKQDKNNREIESMVSIMVETLSNRDSLDAKNK